MLRSTLAMRGFLVSLSVVTLACSFQPDPVGDEMPAPMPPDEGGDDPGDDPAPNEPSSPSEPEPCTALTCAELGAECGMQPDGCGGQVACGGCSGACEDAHCVCATDRMEPNPNADEANDLGEVSDEVGGEWPLEDLSVRDAADEDWFRVQVNDEIGFMNPWITVDLSQESGVHEVDVFFTCSHGNDASSCFYGEAGDASGFGAACGGVGANPGAILTVACEGTLDESGTAWVRVRRTSWDATCATYSLRLTVNR